jgi:lysophospholipase L1-like esterase
MQRTLSKLAAGQPVTIVVVGDSTSVDTPWTFGRKNWVGYLAEALWATYGDSLVTLINSSRCGNRFAAELPRVRQSALRFAPDLVIVGLGLNDAQKEPFDLEACAGQARELLAAIQGSGAEVLLRTFNPVVHGYWQPRPADAAPGEAYDPDGRFARWAARLVALGGEMGCPVVDHFSLWKQHRVPHRHNAAHPQGLRMRMGPDILHPGPVGHLAFFRDLAPAFGVPRYFPWEEAGDA